MLHGEDGIPSSTAQLWLAPLVEPVVTSSQFRICCEPQRDLGLCTAWRSPRQHLSHRLRGPAFQGDACRSQHLAPKPMQPRQNQSRTSSLTPPLALLSSAGYGRRLEQSVVRLWKTRPELRRARTSTGRQSDYTAGAETKLAGCRPNSSVQLAPPWLAT
jgi:hypothetical protein